MNERRVVLVTGGSRGIGRATCKQLSARGLRVALHYNENVRAADESLKALDGEGHATFRADLSQPDAPASLVSEVVQRMGRLDVLVNNAAVYEDHDPRVAAGTSVEALMHGFQRNLDVNLRAPAALSFHAIASMRRRSATSAASELGRIVNVTSRAAFRGELGAPGYAASKAGLNIFGQSLAQALASEGIHVLTVAPGWVDTEMAASLRGPDGPAILAQHPLGRVATADEVASVITWMCLDAPATATGSILDVNGASYLRT
jgi:NAD(P)-dependent dehydrogenase (short-subunit alcohol dehydrogenase family)